MFYVMKKLVKRNPVIRFLVTLLGTLVIPMSGVVVAVSTLQEGRILYGFILGMASIGCMCYSFDLADSCDILDKLVSRLRFDSEYDYDYGYYGEED